MVVTALPATADIGVMHERTAVPSTMHGAVAAQRDPQPNLVPVRPSSSRRYHMSGIDGSPS